MPTGSRSTVGGIAGSNAGTLHNCRFEGVSSGASVVGGIAGTNLAAGVIESCTTTGSVYGAHFIGGIAGENHGIIANCTNTSSVNTTVEQNDIDLSTLTLNDLIGTENVADITDIGGIAGQSGGVIRACMNRGTVGYQHMGYNVGGIAGSQTGYIEGCVNYGTVYARKEGGGIVGQMEPSSTLEYTKDTLQELSDEMSTLQTLVNRACDDASAASSDLSNQLEALKNNVTSSRNAIENLLKQAQNGVSIGSQTIKTDLSQFKQDLKNTNLPGADDGDNAADSDTVIDYGEATPPSDTDLSIRITRCPPRRSPHRVLTSPRLTKAVRQRRTLPPHRSLHRSPLQRAARRTAPPTGSPAPKPLTIPLTAPLSARTTALPQSRTSAIRSTRTIRSSPRVLTTCPTQRMCSMTFRMHCRIPWTSKFQRSS